MAPTPFEHGLALAWSDGALSRNGAKMLEKLQKQLGISDKERALQEQAWLSEISKTERRSFGDGDQILSEWLEALNDTESLSPAARSMGRAALDVGLSKSGWSEALQFAEGLGLAADLAEGVWLEKEAEPLDGWPPALDPLAIILGLVISVPGSVSKKEAQYSNGTPSVSINHPDASPSHLSWMPNLLPIYSDGCEWGWEESSIEDTNMPTNSLNYSHSVLMAWIRRLLTMRKDRGEIGLSGLPEECQLVPSSSEVKFNGDSLTLSMIVDLGDSGLVKPWASVKVDGEPEIIPAPEGISDNWVKIHDALAGLLITGIETLPRQLLLASGTEASISAPTLNGSWIVHDIV
jgi:hypothetical protein